MDNLVEQLEVKFLQKGNPAVALQQKKYMRNQFEFFGIQSADRREIQKLLFTPEHLPAKNELGSTINRLWLKPQREFQYFAQEMAYKFHKQLELADISLYENMVTTKSWWDTVDYIASRLMGEYFASFPEQRKPFIQKWVTSDNLWLKRSALIFQLNYKQQTDEVLLAATIHSLLPSSEFFICKAIGWVLRNYSKVNPEWVLQFVAQTSLPPLSKKEATRLIVQPPLRHKQV